MNTLVRRGNGSSLDPGGPVSRSLDLRDPVSDLNRLVGEIDSVLDRAFTSFGQSRLS